MLKRCGIERQRGLSDVESWRIDSGVLTPGQLDPHRAGVSLRWKIREEFHAASDLVRKGAS